MSITAPLVSVIIASYNHAQFVQACLHSVLAQNLPALEVVVTDDGSTDGTPERVLAMSDARIRFHAFSENRGACVALNDAIQRARGRFIAVLNSDDLFLPGKLARQLAFLESHPEVGAVFGWPTFINEQGEPFHDPAHKDHAVFHAVNRPRQQWLRHFFDQGNALCHPTALIRREVYDAVGLYDPRLAQVPDLDQWIRVCTRFEIHVLPEPLTAFRIRDHQQNASAARPEVVVRDAWERARILTTYLHLPEADQALVFPEFASESGTYAEKLARHALRLPYPFYHRFALDAWFDSLGDATQNPADPAAYARLIVATGKTDLHSIYK
jgi:glycosyltransferase involved in cell wall biosynthesis